MIETWRGGDGGKETVIETWRGGDGGKEKVTSSYIPLIFPHGVSRLHFFGLQ